MSETMVSGGNMTGSDEWKDFDFSGVKVEKPRVTRALPKAEITRFVIAGLVSGVAVWLVHIALEAWVMRPLFCRTPDTASICSGAGSTSFIIALGVVGVITASLLASGRVFRSVLITVATFVSLGALWPLLDRQNGFIATIFTAGFSVLLYLFFALIAAVKRYVLATVLLAVTVIAFWLLTRM